MPRLRVPCTVTGVAPVTSSVARTACAARASPTRATLAQSRRVADRIPVSALPLADEDHSKESWGRHPMPPMHPAGDCPTPPDKSPEGILIDAEPPPAPPLPTPPPATFDFDFDPEEEEDDEYEYDLYRRRERRRQHRAALIWRAITLTMLGVSLVCFFLPWVRYSIVIPFPRQLVDPQMRNPIEVEFGNQSGVQVRRDR